MASTSRAGVFNVDQNLSNSHFLTRYRDPGYPLNTRKVSYQLHGGTTQTDQLLHTYRNLVLATGSITRALPLTQTYLMGMDDCSDNTALA